MVPKNNPELVLCSGSPQDSTHTWALDPPPGRNSFRIVVCGKRTQGVSPAKPHSRFRYLTTIAHALLPMLAFWRTGH